MLAAEQLETKIARSETVFAHGHGQEKPGDESVIYFRDGGIFLRFGYGDAHYKDPPDLTVLFIVMRFLWIIQPAQDLNSPCLHI